jgi:glycerate-2-kinase
LQFDDINEVVIAAIDTDGTDGPTELAGGIIDSSTLERARDKGLDLSRSLLSHDTCTALTELDDAIITGHTGTNVNDLYIMLVR